MSEETDKTNYETSERVMQVHRPRFDRGTFKIRIRRIIIQLTDSMARLIIRYRRKFSILYPY